MSHPTGWLLPQGTPLARTDEIVDHILDASSAARRVCPKNPNSKR
jgi:hypothetical protein